MDRREFFRRAGSGMLLGAPLAALPPAAAALGLPAGNAGTAPLQVIGQADRPVTLALARQLARALGTAGRPLPVHAPDAAALRRSGQIDALLALPRGSHLLGVMDDASAVVFQAMAASRGAHLLARGHHRLAGGGARHACSATGCGEALAWHEAAARPAAHLEDFYRAALGAGRAPARAPAPDAALAAATEAFATFLIRL